MKNLIPHEYYHICGGVSACMNLAWQYTSRLHSVDIVTV